MPVAYAVVAPVVQSLSRTAFKTAVVLYEKARETTERIGETVGDVIAEVEQEMVDARESSSAASFEPDVSSPSAPGDSNTTG